MKTLSDIKIGDHIYRYIFGIRSPMTLTVTEITENQVICGDYYFDKATGAEIDDFFGWGPAGNTGTIACAEKR